MILQTPGDHWLLQQPEAGLSADPQRGGAVQGGLRAGAGQAGGGQPALRPRGPRRGGAHGWERAALSSESADDHLFVSRNTRHDVLPLPLLRGQENRGLESLISFINKDLSSQKHKPPSLKYPSVSATLEFSNVFK